MCAVRRTRKKRIRKVGGRVRPQGVREGPESRVRPSSRNAEKHRPQAEPSETEAIGAGPEPSEAEEGS